MHSVMLATGTLEVQLAPPGTQKQWLLHGDALRAEAQPSCIGSAEGYSF